MAIDRTSRSLAGAIAALAIGGLGSVSIDAQAPERTPYSSSDNWTVTTYHTGETKAFLHCSAERHYGNGLSLTVAKNSAGAFVLGFTSAEWAYEDGATHPVSLQIDSGADVSFPGRVRLLGSGPIVFVDLEASNRLVNAISSGRLLNVQSGETELEFELTGSASAMASLDACHREGSR